MIKDYEEGGLKTIDFDIMSGVIKLKWLQSFLINESSFWNLHVQRSVVVCFFCYNVILNSLNSP